MKVRHEVDILVLVASPDYTQRHGYIYEKLKKSEYALLCRLHFDLPTLTSMSMF